MCRYIRGRDPSYVEVHLPREPTPDQIDLGLRYVVRISYRQIVYGVEEIRAPEMLGQVGEAGRFRVEGVGITRQVMLQGVLVRSLPAALRQIGALGEYQQLRAAI